ncbi:hypothetical protein AB832_02670 [Flavobacteriaceae bacterium (ex Bugula neritina AB1)]|nr:hypothetical protein AB832_02670 [Flavobacteriaceae bacterium (ex Bugula neritina AB1)]
MAIDNLISTSFTAEEVEAINQALTTIETTIHGKVINLTPEERQLYGKLGNRTENWVKKVTGYMDQKPELVPFYLNKTEFDKDVKVREEILPVLRRITSVVESLEDTSKLLSTDIYNAAIAYYRNIKLISQQNVPGTSNIYKDLADQFPGRSSTVPEESKGTGTNS